MITPKAWASERVMQVWFPRRNSRRGRPWASARPRLVSKHETAVVHAALDHAKAAPARRVRKRTEAPLAARGNAREARPNVRARHRGLNLYERLPPISERTERSSEEIAGVSR